MYLFVIIIDHNIVNSICRILYVDQCIKSTIRVNFNYLHEIYVYITWVRSQKLTTSSKHNFFKYAYSICRKIQSLMNCGQINRFTHSTCLTFAVDFIVSIDIIKSHNEKTTKCIKIYTSTSGLHKKSSLNWTLLCVSKNYFWTLICFLEIIRECKISFVYLFSSLTIPHLPSLTNKFVSWDPLVWT